MPLHRRKRPLRRKRVPKSNKKMRRIARQVVLHTAEHKWYNNNIASAQELGYDSPAIQALTCVPISATASNQSRVGREVRGSSLRVDFSVWRSNTQVNFSWARVVIIKAVANMFGALPSAGEVLQDTSTGPIVIHTSYNPVNVNKKSYVVVYDEVFPFTQSTISGSPNTYLTNDKPYHRRLHFNLRGAIMNYVGDSNTYADLGAGHYYLFGWSDGAIAGTANPYIVMNAQFKFTDA